MARSSFGGTTSDWLFEPYTFGQVTLAQLADETTILKFYSAQTGGTQYTDLLDASAVATSTITVTGHQIPRFQGPDGILAMWADKGDDSPRELLQAVDTAAAAAAVAAAAASAAAAAASTSSKADKSSLPIMADDPAYALSGTTDNTTAINAGLTAAGAAARGFHFPKRAAGAAYMVGGTGILLKVPAGVPSVTADPGVVIKVKNSNGDYHSILGGTTAGTDLSGLIVDGLTFDQNSSGNAITVVGDLLVDTKQRFCILVGAGNNLTVRNCRFINVASLNVVYIGSSTMKDVRVTDCEVDVVGAAPAAHDHSTLYLSADGITVTGNKFRGTLGGLGSTTAIETHGPSQVVGDNRIIGYMIGANITGVTDLGNSGIVVHDNTIEKARHGIQLWSYTGTLDGLRDVQIVDNTIRLDRDSWQRDASSFAVGISVAGTSTDHIDGLTIARNSIRQLTFSAAALTGEYQCNGISVAFNDATRELRNFQIDHNRIIGVLGAGIRLNAAMIRGRVSHNQIIDPAASVEAAYTSYWRTGVSFQNDLLDVDFFGNRTIDTRGTHKLVQGFSTSITGTNVRSSQWDNTVVCTDGTVLPESTQTSGKRFIARAAAPLGSRFTPTLYYGSDGARSIVTLTADTATLVPFWVSSAQAFDRIGCEVTVAGAASSVVRLGIYTDNGAGLPVDRVLDAGTVTGDATGTKEITISQTLQPGLYWLLLVGQGGAPQVRAVVNNLPGGAGVSSLAVATGATPRTGYTMTGVSGALPATFTLAGQTALPGLLVLRAA